MKTFVFMTMMIGAVFGQSATILEMQQKLNKQVAALYPTIRTSVNKTVPPFYTEAVNALSYQLAAGTNTLNNYGVQSPLMDWVDFLQANVKALTEFPDAIADFTSDEDYNLRIDFSFVELNESISTLYNKAAADYETKACQGRILSSMNTYSNAVSKNISDAIAFMNRGLSNDAGNEVKLMKKTYTDFHNNITVCSNKRPLSICRSCMLTLLSERGPSVTEYSDNLIHFISDYIDRFFRNLKEQAALVALNMQAEYPKAFNVRCLEVKKS